MTSVFYSRPHPVSEEEADPFQHRVSLISDSFSTGTNLSPLWTAWRPTNSSGFASSMAFGLRSKQARVCNKLGFLTFSYCSLYKCRVCTEVATYGKPHIRPQKKREFEEFSTGLWRPGRSAKDEELTLKNCISSDYVQYYKELPFTEVPSHVSRVFEPLARSRKIA